MKTYFFMGRNENNKGRVSWKISKIERRGSRVLLQWGPAQIDPKRKAIPGGWLQEKNKIFRSEQAAQEYERGASYRKEGGKGLRAFAAA